MASSPSRRPLTAGCDAQRMRIHVSLDEPLPKHLPTGARATVQLYNSEGPFARFFSGMQIHLVSLLHYVY